MNIICGIREISPRTFDVAALIAGLRERTAMRFMGDCKCGKCQLVTREMVDEAATALAAFAEVLKPFAEAVDNLMDGHRDTSEIWESPAAMSITAGDLRRAAAMLEGSGPNLADATPRTQSKEA